MEPSTIGSAVEILLIEDNLGDQELTKQALSEGRIANKLHIVDDGEKAIAYLRKQGVYANVPRPDLILLDLNLPRKDGREVLAEIKEDHDLRRIPVVVLTTSTAEKDVLDSYDHHANCYLAKPIDYNDFLDVMRRLEDFWLTIVRLPKST